MSITLGQALRDPSVAGDLQKYYRGDATKLEPAAKGGDIRAQELRTRIFSLMSGATTSKAPTVLESPTKTTTPMGVIPPKTQPQGINSPNAAANLKNASQTFTGMLPQRTNPQDVANSMYNTLSRATGVMNLGKANEMLNKANAQPQVNAQGLSMEQANDPKYWRDGVYIGSEQFAGSSQGSEGYANITQNQPPPIDDSALAKARGEMDVARNAYVGAEGEAVGFEDKLRAAIQKKADFFKDLNDKRGGIVKDLNTVDSRMADQYADLKEDPYAMRKIMEQERGMLEGNLSITDAQLKQRGAYLDDIINAGVKAEEARIKVSKLSYEAKKEAYEQLKDEKKDLMNYLEKNYEGADVEMYKREYLTSLGYTPDSNLNLLNKAIAYKPGSVGGQCGAFVNRLSGLRLGDSFENKMSQMDPRITTPAPGMVFVMPSSTAKYKANGHTGIILSIKDNIATVIDSNYSDDEKVKIHQIPISKMTGFSTGNASGIVPKTTAPKPPTANELKTQARQIIDNGKKNGSTRDEVETALYEQNIDPNSAFYASYLNDVYGKKETPISKGPADLGKKSYDIMLAIQKGDSEYVSYNTDGTFKDVKWSSVPIAYRDRVKKLLEINTPTELEYPWWSFPQKIKEIGK